MANWASLTSVLSLPRTAREEDQTGRVFHPFALTVYDGILSVISLRRSETAVTSSGIVKCNLFFFLAPLGGERIEARGNLASDMASNGSFPRLS